MDPVFDPAPHAMAGARFVWRAESGLYVRGRWLNGDDDARTAPEREAANLRTAIRNGGEFLVADGRVTSLPPDTGRAGYFRTRTGGTTGGAKTIRRTHASWIASFEVNRRTFGLTAADVYAVPGVPTHSLALYAMVEAAHIGADIHQLAGLSPRSQGRMMAEVGVTTLYATPTQLGLLCDAGVVVPTLRHVICGGGALPERTEARLAEVFPAATLTVFYGAAETSFIAWGRRDRPQGSVGRAYPGVEIRIAPGQRGIGEVMVRSPYLFEGYAEGESAETRWTSGFLTVGEMGRMDDAGNLFVAGRRNRMVTVADQNVFPEDVEALLLGDPAVRVCAVLARSDERRGNVLIAVVAGHPDPAEEARLLGLCRAALGPLAAPRRVIMVGDFPLTPAGKPDLARLAALVRGGT